jgi:hypothetical protein
MMPRNVATDSYLLQICSATENMAKTSLYMFLHKQYVSNAGPEDEQATLLAVAVTNRIFGEKPTGEIGTTFEAQNKDLIESHARQLALDDSLCSCLSGAAYNTSYGRYIAAGGKRGMFSNKFLTYIRTLSRLHDGDYELIRAKTAMEIKGLNGVILNAIESMMALGILRPLSDNPNERKFFDVVHQFAVSTGALKG